jgi:hypothetical protein
MSDEVDVLQGTYHPKKEAPSLTDVDSVRSLLSEVNSLGALVIGKEGDESARKKLINAAEKLIIAARTPGENLYLTAAQVGLLLICRILYHANVVEALSQRINKCCLLHWMFRLRTR